MAPLSKEPFSVERNAAHCPFCGADAVNWVNEDCCHLIADFGDRSDGDRGIMCGPGGSRCGNAALDCLTGLERAIRDFAGVVEPTGYLDKTPSEADSVALARAAGFDDRPPQWLQEVLEVMDYGEGVEDLNLDFAIERIWAATVPWSDRLLKTHAYIGTMASTDVTFVWAADPKDGADQIATSVDQAEHEIRKAIDRLARSNLRVTPDGV